MRVCVAPERPKVLVDALTRAGATMSTLDHADCLVWTGSEPDAFPADLPDSLSWVQLPSAGVEHWLAHGLPSGHRVWTSAAGAYATTVAEHALALLLTGVRGVHRALAQTTWDRDSLFPYVGTLAGATVAIVGAGGIGQAVVPLLGAFGAQVIAVNRSGRSVPGAIETVPASRVAWVWGQADHVVLAAPATAETRGLVGTEAFAALRPTSWVVNVGRGSVIDTAALVRALRDHAIAGAALDVTDPEPLPDDHPLWREPRAVMTPHIANPPRVLIEAFAAHVTENLVRRLRGQELLGEIDTSAGY